MPSLKRFDNCRVVMYRNDHPPPHVHVKLHDGRDCMVDIQTLEIKGRIAEREIQPTLAWISVKQAYLLDEWRRCNP
ncbi:DUF4160 domain-containing protein [Desulfobacter postgatei]|uniref:DUF4160 domain-containing protein n=1 Tax=Desulfobacter postgatei TaxID=2293 RepID=UPI0009FF86EE